MFVGTEDGFEIARADLRLRGMGDLFGERQSGVADVPRRRPAARRAAERAARARRRTDCSTTIRSSSSRSNARTAARARRALRAVAGAVPRGVSALERRARDGFGCDERFVGCASSSAFALRQLVASAALISLLRRAASSSGRRAPASARRARAASASRCAALRASLVERGASAVGLDARCAAACGRAREVARRAVASRRRGSPPALRRVELEQRAPERALGRLGVPGIALREVARASRSAPRRAAPRGLAHRAARSAVGHSARRGRRGGRRRPRAAARQPAQPTSEPRRAASARSTTRRASRRPPRARRRDASRCAGGDRPRVGQHDRERRAHASVLSHRIVPPCASTISFAIARPEPGALRRGGRLVVRLEELLEDVRQLLRRDAGAGVAHLDLHVVVARRRRSAPPCRPRRVNLNAFDSRLPSTSLMRSASHVHLVGQAVAAR